MSIYPTRWSVAIQKHERWEYTRSPLRKTLLGHDWTCEGRVGDVSLPIVAPGYHRFTLRREGHAPLSWVGAWTCGETEAVSRLIWASFQVVDDGRTEFTEELNLNQDDPGCLLEIEPVMVNRYGEFAPDAAQLVSP